MTPELKPSPAGSSTSVTAPSRTTAMPPPSVPTSTVPSAISHRDSMVGLGRPSASRRVETTSRSRMKDTPPLPPTSTVPSDSSMSTRARPPKAPFSSP